MNYAELYTGWTNLILDKALVLIAENKPFKMTENKLIVWIVCGALLVGVLLLILLHTVRESDFCM